MLPRTGVAGYLTIPDRHVVLLHKLNLSIIHPPNVTLLLFGTLESTNPVGEPKTAVIVDRVYRILPDFVKASEIHAEAESQYQLEFGDKNEMGVLTYFPPGRECGQDQCS